MKKSNPLILAYVRITLSKVYNFNVLRPAPFQDYSILDFGCSDGFLSESIALLGAKQVVGVDSSQDNIVQANKHKESDARLLNLSYVHADTPESFLKNHWNQTPFDVVYSGGVAEQIEDLQSYIKTCCLLLAPGGSIFISTVNRTITSFFWTIIIERVLFLAPKGSYAWSKYVQPQELIALMESNSVFTKEVSGLTFSSTSGQWIMTSDLSSNYIIWARKELTSLPPARAKVLVDYDDNIQVKTKETELTIKQQSGVKEEELKNNNIKVESIQKSQVKTTESVLPNTNNETNLNVGLKPDNNTVKEAEIASKEESSKRKKQLKALKKQIYKPTKKKN